ncbi:hypothetical protein DL768_002894 [Monosporascus sp. mg162]|nr:hypothetical protein DL768_002894 [Monosporascus sp. mg162]
MAKPFGEEIKIAERIGSRWRPGQLTDSSIPADITHVKGEINGVENKNWAADAPRHLWEVLEERKNKIPSRGDPGGRGGGARRAVQLNPCGDEMTPW